MERATAEVDGVHLRWLALPSGLDAARYADALTPLERRRYLDTVDAGAGERFVFGRILLRQLAAELTGVPASLVTVAARCASCGGPHGRPMVGGPDARLASLAVSIAHCAEAVVVAAGWTGPLGVDVEAVAGPADRSDAIRAVAGGPFTDDPGRAPDAILHWTRVEAVLKADGRGLEVDPRRVRVRELRGEIDATVAGGGTRYRLREAALDPALRVSVALADTSSASGPRRPWLGWRREDELALS